MKRSLTPFERFIQGFAFVLAGVGVLSMLVYLGLLWAKGYRVNTDVDPAVTGEVGDFVGGVAGSLFALAATLLFYLALTLQRREFQNSLTELQISSSALKSTEEHHRSTVQVMREEKEFNVCHTATLALIEEVKNWRLQSNKGVEGIAAITRAWRDMFKPTQVEEYHRTRNHVLQDEAMIPAVLQGSSAILELHVRVNWVVRSIRSKDIAEMDRQYLNSYVLPLYHAVHDASNTHLQSAIASLNRFLLLPDQTLTGKGLSRVVLEAYHKRFTDILAAWGRDITQETEPRI